MQDIRLIALDLDGTVFNDRKEITPRTLAAIRAALDRGVTVIPATGRTITGVPEEFLHMPGIRYALTSNGATVAELATGRRLVNLPFTPQLAIQVYDIVKGFDSMLSIFIDGLIYTDPHSDALAPLHVDAALLPYLRNTRIVVEDMHATMLAHLDGVEKFSIIYKDNATRDAAQAAVLAQCRVEATSSLERNLELNAPGVTKGRGLLALARVLGLQPSQVMACGDSGNDLAMLQAAGLGVAMGNATAPVKAVAQYITADNNHDGVAEAIERFVLGR